MSKSKVLLGLCAAVNINESAQSDKDTADRIIADLKSKVGMTDEEAARFSGKRMSTGYEPAYKSAVDKASKYAGTKDLGDGDEVVYKKLGYSQDDVDASARHYGLID